MADAHWHPKREARRFEPPPWERAQFEEMERRRKAEAEAQERAQREAEEAARAEVAGEPETTAEEPQVPVAVQTEKPAEKPQAPAVPERAAPPQRDSRPVSEAQMDAMLIQLHGEEPKVDEHLKPVGVFAAAVAMLIGLSIFLWGVIAVLKTRGNTAGIVGGFILIFFGIAMAAAGFWVGWRVTNRQ